MSGVSASDVEENDVTSKIVATPTSIDTSKAGVYSVKYSVTDLDGNKDEETRIILVNDSNYDAGDNYIIKAEDYTKYISEVNTSDASIISAANVKVYDKKTGLEVVNQTITVDKGSYKDDVGVYPIRFSVASDANATITKNATVIAGNKPVITVNPEFSKVNKGTAFDVKSGVSASDKEDGEIPVEEIKVSGAVDTSKAGIYEVEYRVEDSDGNIGVENQVVVVNDGTYIIDGSSNYIIGAKNFSVTDEEAKIISDEGIIENGEVMVYDMQTADPVSNPKIAVDRSEFVSEPGVHLVGYEYLETEKVGTINTKTRDNNDSNPNPNVKVEANVIGTQKDLVATGSRNFLPYILISLIPLTIYRRKFR